MNEKIILRDGEIAFLENGQTTMIMNVNTAIELYKKMRLVQLDSVPEPTDKEIEEVNKEYGLSDMFNDVVKDTAEHLGINLNIPEKNNVETEKSNSRINLNIPEKNNVETEKSNKIDYKNIFTTHISKYGNAGVNVERIFSDGSSTCLEATGAEPVFVLCWANKGKFELFANKISVDRRMQMYGCPKGSTNNIVYGNTFATYSITGNVFTVVETSPNDIKDFPEKIINRVIANVGRSLTHSETMFNSFDDMLKYFKINHLPSKEKPNTVLGTSVNSNKSKFDIKVKVEKIDVDGIVRIVEVCGNDPICLALCANTGNYVLFANQISAGRYLQSVGCPRDAAHSILSKRQHATYSTTGNIYTVVATNPIEMTYSKTSALNRAASNIGKSVVEPRSNWDYETMKKYFKF